jgi:hypothetical protein
MYALEKSEHIKIKMYMQSNAYNLSFEMEETVSTFQNETSDLYKIKSFK